MDTEQRAMAYAALGEPRRLLIVDELIRGDRTVSELAETVTMPGNLLAHHLDVLEKAGLIERRVSEGDHRRRYVTLRRSALPRLPFERGGKYPLVAFVCTHNSARSQFAAALWEDRSGRSALSAGTHPSPSVHPGAVSVAAEFGIDLSDCRPKGYDRLSPDLDLLVSVCDRAREAEIPIVAEHIHWSVPDPVHEGTASAFRRAFAEITERVDHMVEVAGTEA
jgi:ArsR family transcriptional regulator, arsenate/arsenite/antimonite-responsive transcriptional repressor / arsenate reductase (thioredoxin)